MSTSDFTVEKLISDDSFRAWAKGRAGLEEKKYWDRWVRKSDKNRHLARRAQAQLIGFSFRSLTRPQTNRAWNRLQQRIMAGQTQPRQILAVAQSRREWWYGIAASVLVIITAGLIGLFMATPPGEMHSHSTWQKIHTTYGQRKKIALSNGSVIMLGANSTLRYQTNLPVSQPVRIRLRGKAYFSTDGHDHHRDRAFAIQTPAGRIFDIGTQFVVSTREGHTRVVLKRGKVAIEQKGKSDKKPVLLHPNQMATFSKTAGDIHIKSVNTAVYTSWTTDKLIFDHTPLTAFAERLQHTFGKSVVVCGSRLRQRLLSGSVANGNLTLIMGAVAKALHTSYTIKVDTVYLGSRCE